MRIATAWAPINIALVKHWGFADGRTDVPARSSLSLTLEHGATTTVEWKQGAPEDRICLDGRLLERSDGEKAAGAFALLDAIRRQAGLWGASALVDSRSEVPVSGGMASSAAGAAALTLAALQAAGLGDELRDPDRLRWCAHFGSLSGLRSLEGGVVALEAGATDLELRTVETSLDLVVLSALVEEGPKKVSSSAGHLVAGTSPFWASFRDADKRRIREMEGALRRGDIEALGEQIESDALAMHGVMRTSQPAVVYATPRTWDVWHAVRRWRSDGLLGFSTLDAGPNPHVICRGQDADELERRLRGHSFVRHVWRSELRPQGAQLLDEPLRDAACF